MSTKKISDWDLFSGTYVSTADTLICDGLTMKGLLEYIDKLFGVNDSLFKQEYYGRWPNNYTEEGNMIELRECFVAIMHDDVEQSGNVTVRPKRSSSTWPTNYNVGLKKNDCATVMIEDIVNNRGKVTGTRVQFIYTETKEFIDLECYFQQYQAVLESDVEILFSERVSNWYHLSIVRSPNAVLRSLKNSTFTNNEDVLKYSLYILKRFANKFDVKTFDEMLNLCDRIFKYIELAKRGIGGEKETAQRMLTAQTKQLKETICKTI